MNVPLSVISGMSPKIDLLLLDVADGLDPGLGILVPDDETDGDLERDRVGHAALLALVDVVLELHRRPSGRRYRRRRRAPGLPCRNRGHSTSWSPYGSAISVAPQLAARLAQVVQTGELAALAFPVADRVLDELERRVLAEVADRKDRLEDRLQAGVLALRRQTIHLQEALVRLPLDLDQVRDGNRGLDLREILAFAVDVLGKAVHR